jgi:hypothetical protein
MNPATKMDFKKIKDAINSLGRSDQRTYQTTKLGDNPANVDNVLTLIEDLCAVIREQEGLYREEAMNPFTGEIVRVQCSEAT